jgi:hypothetical protein
MQEEERTQVALSVQPGFSCEETASCAFTGAWKEAQERAGPILLLKFFLKICQKIKIINK